MSPSDLGVFVLAKQGAAADEAGGSSAVKGNTMTAVKQAVCTGVRNVRTLTRVSLHPIPKRAALEGCTAVALMAEYNNAKQASEQCARACGALTRVRRACLWRSQHAFATPLPQGGTKERPARVDSVTSQCVLPALPRPHLLMPTKCARLHWLRTVWLRTLWSRQQDGQQERAATTACTMLAQDSR